MYYFNARWYDPTLGKFITEDPARDGDNWYTYCSNNPLNLIDPTGLEEQNFLQKVGSFIWDHTIGPTVDMAKDLGNRVSQLPYDIAGAAYASMGVQFASDSNSKAMAMYEQRQNIGNAQTNGYTAMAEIGGLAATAVGMMVDPAVTTMAPGQLGVDVAIQSSKNATGSFIKRELSETLVDNKTTTTAGNLANAITTPTNRQALRTGMLKEGPPPSTLTKPQAHHGLPWENREWFAKRGLNVNEPQYGAWVQGGGNGGHQSWSAEYSRVWSSYIERSQNATANQVLDFYNSIRSSVRWGGGF